MHYIFSLTWFMLGITLHYMATKRKQQPQNVTIRPTPEDLKLMDDLGAKLGVSVSQVIRLGLRALATKEGMTA